MYLPTISASELLGNYCNSVSMLITGGAAGLVAFGVNHGLQAIAQKILSAETYQRNEKYLSYTFRTVAILSGIAVGCLIAPKLFLVQLTARKIVEAAAFGLLIGVVCKLIDSRTSRAYKNSVMYSRPKPPSKRLKVIFAFVAVSVAVGLGGVPILRLGAVVGALVGSSLHIYKRDNLKDNVINQDDINRDVFLTGHRANFIPE
jgi:hypothetical protein